MTLIHEMYELKGIAKNKQTNIQIVTMIAPDVSILAASAQPDGDFTGSYLPTDSDCDHVTS